MAKTHESARECQHTEDQLARIRVILGLIEREAYREKQWSKVVDLVGQAKSI